MCTLILLLCFYPLIIFPHLENFTDRFYCNINQNCQNVHQFNFFFRKDVCPSMHFFLLLPFTFPMVFCSFVCVLFFSIVTILQVCFIFFWYLTSWLSVQKRSCDPLGHLKTHCLQCWVRDKVAVFSRVQYIQ